MYYFSLCWLQKFPPTHVINNIFNYLKFCGEDMIYISKNKILGNENLFSQLRFANCFGSFGQRLRNSA